MFVYVARRVIAALVATIVLASISVSSASAATVNNPEGLFFDKSCRKVSFHLEVPWPEKGNIVPVTYAVFDEKTSRVLAEGTVPAGDEDDAIDVLRTFKFPAYSGLHNLTAWVDGRFLAETSVRTNCGVKVSVLTQCVILEGWWSGEVALDVTLNNRTNRYRSLVVSVIGKKLGFGRTYLVGPYSKYIVPQMIIDSAAYGGQVVSIIVATPSGKELKVQSLSYADCTK